MPSSLGRGASNPGYTLPAHSCQSGVIPLAVAGWLLSRPCVGQPPPSTTRQSRCLRDQRFVLMRAGQHNPRAFGQPYRLRATHACMITGPGVGVISHPVRAADRTPLPRLREPCPVPASPTVGTTLSANTFAGVFRHGQINTVCGRWAFTPSNWVAASKPTPAPVTTPSPLRVVSAP